jgi:hypothetical protein
MKIKVDDVVACVDCKHYLRTFGMRLRQADARCTRSYTPTVDLVTGKVPKMDWYSLDRCHRERQDDYSLNCGSRGRFWAPRESTPKTTLLLLKRTSNETN